MRTLADMTEEERAECRGMWCETTYGMAQGMRLFCGEGLDQFMNRGIVAKMISPNREGFGFVPFSDVTPRFDLPRAWQADGTPPAGKWEHSERLSMGVTTVYLCGKENPTHRYFVTDWEPIPGARDE